MHRLFEFIELTDHERHTLDRLQGPSFKIGRGQTIRSLGDEVTEAYFLLEGWVLSSVGLAGGDRQIVKIHLPGDMLGSPSLVLRKAAETLTAVTPATLTKVSLKGFGRLFYDAPRLAAAFFMSCQQERVVLMDRITSVGRTRAAQRLAAFLLHLHDRLRVIAPEQDAAFHLPLTQEQIGDTIGLTSVHVNRTFREFDAMGIVHRRGHMIELRDFDALRRLAAVPAREWVRFPDWLPSPN